jgi:tRNA dimethylallyltransferase
MHNFLIVILGPTGVGKTDTSFSVAQSLGTEIISCDSRQFYREMSIGTAVPSQEMLDKVHHHFIQFLPVTGYYSASLFERDVLALLPSLFRKNNIVLMAGGSGLYIDAVCSGIDDIPDVDRAIREKYSKIFAEEGIEALRFALKVMDPDHYNTVDLKNHKRIIRALEICETTGKPYSSFLRKEKPSRKFRMLKIGLERPRTEMYDAINRRVDTMISLGLEEEARSLYRYRHLNALNTVGYREFFEYFDGNISLEKTIELIKRNTRRYAKRQLTWWAKDMEIVWFHPDCREEILEHIRKNVSSKG